MKIFTIARQEWSDKRMVWGAAFVVGLLCFAVPAFMGLKGLPLEGGRAVASFTLAITLALSMALICGAGMIAPDLQEGRFGFFLSQPIQPFQVFFGKWMGAAAVSLGAGLLVLLPLGLAHPTEELILPCLGPIALIALLGTLAGHAFSTALRARTTWLLLDAVTLLSLVAMAAWGRWRLSSISAFDEQVLLFLMVLVACTAGLGIVGWRMVAMARSDLKRSHRVLSMGAAAMVALVGFGAWCFVWNVAHVSAEHMGPAILIQAARQGTWVHMHTESGLMGDLGKRYSQVLLDTSSGRGVRSGLDAIISAQGNRAVWRARSFNREDVGVWVADLGAGDAKVHATDIHVPNRNARMAISADGRKMATEQEDRLAVYDLDTGALLVRGPADSSRFLNHGNDVVFIGPGLLRCYAWESGDRFHAGPVSIWEMQIENGRLRKTGTVDLPGEGQTWLWDRDPLRESVLASRVNGKTRIAYLCDARSGGIIKALNLEEDRHCRARFLSDGSIAMTGIPTGKTGTCWIKHFDSKGRELGVLMLGGITRPQTESMRGILLGGETRQGVLIARTTDPSDPKHVKHQSFQVDFNSNTVNEIPDKGWAPDMDIWSRDLLGPFAPGSLPTRLRGDGRQGLSIQEGDHLRQITTGTAHRAND